MKLIVDVENVKFVDDNSTQTVELDIEVKEDKSENVGDSQPAEQNTAQPQQQPACLQPESQSEQTPATNTAELENAASVEPAQTEPVPAEQTEQTESAADADDTQSEQPADVAPELQTESEINHEQD